MQFNTWEFLWFCSAMLLLYWLLKRWHHLQNLLLVVGSIYFYSRLHISFPFYLAGLILSGYLFGQLIDQSEKYRKGWLILSIIILSSCLVILKYTNFGVDIVNGMGSRFDLLKFIVPVGLSFYTFSSIGYVTDVYRKKVTAQKDLVAYGAYISFFPHLLSGPIPNATTILPQFVKNRNFGWTDIEPAIQQILWGLFKKMVIADNISISVNYCFAHADSLNSLSLYLGIVLFSFQIYADFSAYSEIARGVAKLFGIDLFINFKLPFLSRNPSEFWRRWHVSLTQWLTDYIYKPLGGRSLNRLGYILAILFIFFFSGLWHGANWTFVLWGLLNGVYYITYLLFNQIKQYPTAPDPEKWLPSWSTFFKIFLTFHLITFSRILFKAEDLDKATLYFVNLFSQHNIELPPAFLYSHLHWCVLLVLVEWVQRFRLYPLDINAKYYIRVPIYILLIILIILYHKQLSLQEYYYFRF